MHTGWRAPALRLTSLPALVVSAALTADHLHPERAFCPLAAACEKARESALGSILGVPTSVLGMAAFGLLFLLTLLPVRLGRRLLRPAGILAAVCGAGLFLYQALVLHSYCPLCLVADAACLLCGALVISWPKPPVRRSGKDPAVEHVEHRLRWTALALIAVAAPFLWPRNVRPAWVPVEDASALAFADPAFEPPSGPEPGSEAPSPPPPPPAPTTPPAPPTPSLTPPAPPAPPAPRVPRAAPPKAEVAVVEYVNAFCPHCRATRARLDRVLAESGVVARRRRVSTWAGANAPLWARVCAAAEPYGLSDRVFAELERADAETPREVWAAVERAGADVQALSAALSSPDVAARLERDRRVFSAARLEGLPTVDVGRRRLMGEQSEDDLRDAIRAARAPR